MSRIPPHSGKEMIDAFLRAGFVRERTSGDHVALWREGLLRPVIVPLYAELPDFIVSNNLRTAGIGRKEYLALLGKHRKH
jgi:predicted RNA binding protein YcfA (HicA-like mRNA interferase family)